MRTANYKQWQQMATEISFVGQAFIDGQLCDADSGATFDCISPRDNSCLTQIARCADTDVDRAVAAARRSFEAGVWSSLAPKKRKHILLRFAKLLEQHAQELALLETLDMGMTINDSVTMDLPGAVECVNWYAELADKIYDEVAPTQPDALTRIHRVPVGVVAAIVPWNYPLMIACWKVAPALAVGNSVVLKPAEQSSLTAIRMAQLAFTAGIPAGVFNVVTGFGEEAGKALGLHNDVDALAFTGSTRVGGLYMQYAGQSNLKRVALECGGKTANIVLGDVQDLDKAAEAIVLGAFSNQGQICNAGSRLIVDRQVHAPLMALIRQKTLAIRQGDPLDPDTEFSCLVNRQHSAQVVNYIDLGKQAGAELVCGGGLMNQGECYLQPTIFDAVNKQMRIAQEEIFGPVLSVMVVDGIDEAIDVANSTIYALGAALWTQNMRLMEQAFKRIKAGVVWINCHDHGDISSPVGGFKQSGFGRDKSIHALDKYVEYKTLWIDLQQ